MLVSTACTWYTAGMDTGSALTSAPVPARPPTRQRRELTDRELDVLLKVASSWSNGAIAKSLGVNSVTVTNTLRRVYELLDVQDRIGAVIRAFEEGILAVPNLRCPHCGQRHSTEDSKLAEPSVAAAEGNHREPVQV